MAQRIQIIELIEGLNERFPSQEVVRKVRNILTKEKYDDVNDTHKTFTEKDIEELLDAYIMMRESCSRMFDGI